MSPASPRLPRSTGRRHSEQTPNILVESGEQLRRGAGGPVDRIRLLSPEAMPATNRVSPAFSRPAFTACLILLTIRSARMA
jgi:hypothetical protein